LYFTAHNISKACAPADFRTSHTPMRRGEQIIHAAERGDVLTSVARRFSGGNDLEGIAVIVAVVRIGMLNGVLGVISPATRTWYCVNRDSRTLPAGTTASV
jgi:hypothetical protein